jgi:hypothetical protein
MIRGLKFSIKSYSSLIMGYTLELNIFILLTYLILLFVIFFNILNIFECMYIIYFLLLIKISFSDIELGGSILHSYKFNQNYLITIITYLFTLYLEYVIVYRFYYPYILLLFIFYYLIDIISFYVIVKKGIIRYLNVISVYYNYIFNSSISKIYVNYLYMPIDFFIKVIN